MSSSQNRTRASGGDSPAGLPVETRRLRTGRVSGTAPLRNRCASLLLMQGRERTDSPAVAKNLAHDVRSWTHSIFFIVLVAFLLRLAVITIGHTYRITPRRDHFQFGWEMGRIARSIATGQGFSSPTDLPTGPSAWAPPVYPYILAGVFKLFGIYSNLSGMGHPRLQQHFFRADLSHALSDCEKKFMESPSRGPPPGRGRCSPTPSIGRCAWSGR